MKENRYNSMVRLRDALNCMFEQCGLDLPKVEIKMSPKIIEVVNCFFQDKAVCEYLDTLTEQSVQAKKKIEDINIKQWNYEQIEKKYMLLKDSVEREKEKAEEAKKAEEAQKEKEARRAEEAQKVKDAEKTKENLDIIKQIITLRDNLAIKLDMAKEAEENNVIKVIEGELKQTKRILESADVEVTDHVEQFDSSKHMIAGVRHTDDPGMADHIAAVLRPGYAYKGEIIRPVELILYTEEEDYVTER